MYQDLIVGIVESRLTWSHIFVVFGCGRSPRDVKGTIKCKSKFLTNRSNWFRIIIVVVIIIIVIIVIIVIIIIIGGRGDDLLGWSRLRCSRRRRLCFLLGWLLELIVIRVG